MVATKRAGMLVAVAAIASLQTGCIVGSSCGIATGHFRRTATSELRIETAGLSALDVRTHNGSVAYRGGAAEELSVLAKKTASGLTSSDAQAALEAIDVYVEDAGDGRKKLGWRWGTAKHLTWGGGVSFAIEGPASLGVDVETHNGGVEVVGVAGHVKAVTHNGAVVASSSGGSLVVETHNGRIEADYSGPSLSLATSNGAVDADLSDCGAVTGDITTSNGGVRVIVGPATAADVECETHNGGIHADGGIDVRKVSRHRFDGTIGAGGLPLTVRTHNGGIKLKKVG